MSKKLKMRQRQGKLCVLKSYKWLVATKLKLWPLIKLSLINRTKRRDRIQNQIREKVQMMQPEQNFEPSL